MEQPLATPLVAGVFFVHILFTFLVHIRSAVTDELSVHA